MSLADNINLKKKEKNLTNLKLSKVSGVAKSTIDKLTSGESTNPCINTLEPLANTFNCSLDDLLDRPSRNSTPKANFFSNEESEIIRKYRLLDSNSKETVSSVLNFAYTSANFQIETNP